MQFKSTAFAANCLATFKSLESNMSKKKGLASVHLHKRNKNLIFYFLHKATAA